MAILALFAATTALGASPEAIYWTDRGAGVIERADLSGAGRVTLVTGLAGPQGIAIDPIRAHIYWADSTDRDIKRANLDGSGVVTLIDAPFFIPKGLALDLEAEKIYWCDPALGNIHRADLDGAGMETVVSGLNGPQDLAVAGGRVFWAQGPDGVLSASIDSAVPTPLVSAFAGSTTVLALTPDGCRVYWAAADRFSFTATRPGSCVTDLTANFLDEAVGLAIESVSGDLIWTEDDAILRTDPEAQSITPLLTGLPQPWRIALGPTAVAPTVLAQPASIVVAAGDDAALAIDAGGSAPLAYQWLLDGQPLADGGEYAGAQSPTLTITGAGLPNVGAYACVVTNAHGQATSAPAVLGVRSCVGDLDGDASVDLADFAALASSFGAQNLTPGDCDARAFGDLDADGAVTLSDFTLLALDFGCTT